MGLVMIVFLIAVCVFISCLIIYRKKFFSEHSYTFNSGKEKRAEEAEKIKKESILKNIDDFLSSAHSVEPLGSWGGDNVYKYIGTKDRVYEFVDFMPKESAKIGIDDQFLCYKQMVYKRVEDVKQFLDRLEGKQEVNISN